MDAIRQFIEVKDHSFQVTLPNDFTANRVEVIILPLQNDTFELPESTQKILEERLEQYRKNPNDVSDFDQLLKELGDEI
ncbi:hypothetical protein [Flavobacterium poyangense]|uniref:hypothetical protein n=1 Tax=Flavobacterium poyangense TaxID=2204302 RepID=UPI00141DC6A1|nr:hypothetical protein [Flavobacterium sp. JXAS1]